MRDSIKAGVDNDLGSGASIDICTMKLDSVNRRQETSATVKTYSEELYTRGMRLDNNTVLFVVCSLENKQQILIIDMTISF